MTRRRFNLTAYILPSVISMVVVGTNANIDGFFIGGILGDDGLAAINLAWPIVACITSLGTGIGVGGAVLLGRARGEGDTTAAERIKNTTLLLLAASGLLVGLVFYLFCEPLLAAMSAAGAVLTHAAAYARVIAAGAVFQVVAAGLPVLLRNDGKTYRSMLYSLVGLFLHLGLNFLLADRFVMGGLAAATVLSQLAVAVLCLLSLTLERAARVAARDVPVILGSAAAPFGINFVPSLVLLFTNAAALREGEVAAVSAYAAMSYAVYTFDYIFQGVCDGIQPVVSFSRGAGDRGEEARALKSAVWILSLFSGFCIAVTPLLIRFLPPVLHISGAATALVARGFWLYALSYPFKAAVKFIGSYYYAIGQPLHSNILVYLDPLVFTPLTLAALTAWCGTDGVWLSMPVTQMAVTLIGVGLILYSCKKGRGLV